MDETTEETGNLYTEDTNPNKPKHRGYKTKPKHRGYKTKRKHRGYKTRPKHGG